MACYLTEHHDTMAEFQLAVCKTLRDQGKYEEIERILLQVKETRELLADRDDFYISNSLQGLAYLYYFQHRLSESSSVAMDVRDRGVEFGDSEKNQPTRAEASRAHLLCSS